MTHAFDRLQDAWFLHVNQLARSTPWLHDPMRWYASYGVLLFVLLLGIGWWLARRDPEPRRMAAALWSPVATLCAVALNQPIVDLVRERRPFVVYPHALVLVHHANDPGFPSDHAVMAGAVAAGLLLVNRRLGLVAALAAVLISFARVYVGVHFPLDVLAGMLLGAVVAGAGFASVRVPLTALVRTLDHSRLRPLAHAGDVLPAGSRSGPLG